MRIYDSLFFGFVGLGAILLALYGFCVADWLFAIITIAVTLFWAWLIYCRIRNGAPPKRWDK